MKWRTAFLATCLAAAQLTFAGPGGGAVEIFDRPAPLIAADLLFVELPELFLPGPHEIQVEYRVSGRGSSMAETIRLEVPAMDGSPVVELLAWYPREREMIRREGLTHDVQIVLTLDGEVTRTLSLVELTVESARLTLDGFIPLEIRSELSSAVEPDISRVLAASSGCTQQQCYDDCYAYFNQCEGGCGIPPAEDCLQRCDWYFHECQAFCAVCPKTIKTWVEEEVISATQTGNFRCSVFFGFARPHEEYLTTKKRTFYKQVKDCCGAYTTIVTNVTYWTGLCYLPLPDYTCSPPVFPPACLIGV